MFKKLIGNVAAANLKAITAKGGLACPVCGAKPNSTSSDPDRLITCGSCGTKALPAEWVEAARNGGVVGNTDQPPALTRITRTSEAAGTIAWNIPASGKSGRLFFFALIWCILTAIVGGGFLFQFVTKGQFDTDSNLPEWMLITFLGVFWAVGLSILYLAVRNRYTHQKISLNRNAVTLRRELFGKVSEKFLPRDAIQSIAQAVFYLKNHEPVYGVEIRGQKGRLRFGSDLSNEEKSWLVGCLRREIFGPVTASPKPVNVHTDGCFSVSAPLLVKHNLPFAIASLLMGCLFLWVIIRFWPYEVTTTIKGEPLIFRMMDLGFAMLGNVFRVIFFLISGSMVVGGITLIVWVFWHHGEVTEFQGNSSTIIIRRLKAGRVLKEQSFPRQSVTDICSSISSITSGITTKRIQLIIGDKAETVANSIIADKADAVVAEVRQAMGIA